MRIEMELQPGTPEYKEAYDKEMQRLEAEATKEPEKKPEAKEAEIPPEKAEKLAEAAKPDPEELRKEVEALKKRVADTQSWGHKNATELARLKREAEERKHAAERPAILEANPGLEDAIKHVAGTRNESEADSKAQWLSTVSTAVPDVEQLLGDQAFHAKASARKVELGAEWDNPLIAIRELSSLKTEHLRQKSVQAAVESARKDFETKAKKRTAMDVPGGSGGKGDAASQEDAVKRYQNMSTADFNKERAKVMGGYTP